MRDARPLRPRARRAHRAAPRAVLGAAPRAALRAALLLAALAPAAAAGAQVLPFYQDLLSQGTLALQRGAHAEAERDLRLAAFGMLEEPPLLVATLARLALAQQPLDRGPQLDETLERLLTVERRFAVWDQAPLPEGTRRSVAELLLARVPEASLLAIPAFQPLAEQKLVRRLEAMKPAERRRALAAEIARAPDSPRLQVLLGEEELAAGELPSASSRASRALAAGGLDAPLETRARCLRGAALARAGGCAAAVADLERCPDARRQVEPARDLLACRLQLGQWSEAQALAAALPPEVARNRALARLDLEAARRLLNGILVQSPEGRDLSFDELRQLLDAYGIHLWR
ncbi:MAG TPA: hypothetical protein VHQ65_13500, partial [Thermoanaerobaculia bacterium]|nr:hypothetical protein [Thermoanaerobaculia bacterium]